MKESLDFQLDIAFYKGSGIISKMVEKLTRSRYSHCAVILTQTIDGDAIKTVYDINWDRKFSGHKLTWKENEYDTINVKITDRDIKTIIKYLNEYSEDVSYDFMVNLKFLLKKFNIHIPIKSDKDRWNCVEAAYGLLYELVCGIQLADDEMTPVSLYFGLCTMLEVSTVKYKLARRMS